LGTGSRARGLRLRGTERQGSQLIASFVDGLHDQVSLVGLERRFEPHHPIWQVAQANHSLGAQPIHGELSFALGLLADELTAQPAIPTANALQLSPGRNGRNTDQALLRLGRGDPGDGPNLGIRNPSCRQRRIEDRQLPQRPRHPNLLARSRGVEADPPAQPVRAALRPLMMPFLGRIELPDARQQSMRPRIELRSQQSDLIPQPPSGDRSPTLHLNTLHLHGPLTIRMFSQDDKQKATAFRAPTESVQVGPSLRGWRSSTT
jgi:hypothetical protein